MTLGRKRAAGALRGALASAFLAMCVGPYGAHAVEPDEILADAALEARARTISRDLRCVVCQSQSIDDSDAPLARDLRVLVRERLVAGDTDQMVRDYVVERYGDYVLLKPRFSANTAALWLAPAVGFALAAVGGVWVLRRRPKTPAPTLTDDEQREIDRLLSS